MSASVCVYVSASVCLCVYVSASVRLCVYVSASVCVCMFECLCVCVRSMCMFECLCVCVCVCLFMCVCLVLYQNSSSDELPSVMHIPSNLLSFVSELQQPDELRRSWLRFPELFFCIY